jgi:hypothetical protein
MRKFSQVIALGLLGIVLAGGPARADDYTACVDVRATRDQVCGSNDGVSIDVRNGCQNPVQTSFCMQRENGTWDCGMDFDLPPGGHTTSYTCHGTGEVRHVACEPYGRCSLYGNGQQLMERH